MFDIFQVPHSFFFFEIFQILYAKKDFFSLKMEKVTSRDNTEEPLVVDASGNAWNCFTYIYVLLCFLKTALVSFY